MAGGKGDARKAVLAAMFANMGLAVAKFVAAYFSGSSTMLAEGVHSVADSTNQALLLLGMGLSKGRRTDLYPVGRAKETYFWSFIVALMLFFLGGVYAIYSGVKELLADEHAPVHDPLVSVGVLVFGIAIEAWSLFVALREFNQQRGDKPISQALFDGKDPVIPVILLEDTAAVLGLLFALVAVGTSWLTGLAWIDSLGSIVIGVLLCTVGVALGRDTRSLLIGEGVTPAIKKEVVEIVEGVKGVESLSQLIGLHMGPETVLLMMKVRLAGDPTLTEAEAITNAIEDAVTEKLPMMKKIFVEFDRVYDPSKDPDNLPA